LRRKNAYRNVSRGVLPEFTGRGGNRKGAGIVGMKRVKDLVNSSGMADEQLTGEQVAAAQGTRIQGEELHAGHFGQFGGLPPAVWPAISTGPAGNVKSGTVRNVMITGMRQIGTNNIDLMVEFDLTVMPDGLPTYPVTTLQAVSQGQFGQLRPGMTMPASVEGGTLAVWLDLTTLR
jgi:hypothetical protein